MIPTVTQQLQSLKTRLAETIIPALPGDELFAQEQAGLMVANIDWLLDTHEYQYRYEVIENVDYRQLLAALTDGDEAKLIDDATLAEVRDTMSEPGPQPQDASMALGEIADQNRELKEHTRQVFTALSAVPGSEALERARTLLANLAVRQGERELAWFRMTGFPQSPGEVGAVLEANADTLGVDTSHSSRASSDGKESSGII